MENREEEDLPPRLYSDNLKKHISLARNPEELAWIRGVRSTDSIYTPIEVLLLDHLGDRPEGDRLVPLVDKAKSLFRGWVYATERSDGEFMTRGDARAQLRPREGGVDGSSREQG